MDRIEDAKPDWMRRGWVPQPVGQGNQAPTMDGHGMSYLESGYSGLKDGQD